LFTPELPLPTEWWHFLLGNAHLSPPAFALKAAQCGLPHLWLADQHKARLKAFDKLPDWVRTDGVVLPPVANLEQASSTETAKLKASLLPFSCFADLTGGTGVDTLAFAKKCSMGHYIEQDEVLYKLATFNLPLLGAGHIHTHHTDASCWSSLQPLPDLLLLDPSRRVEGKRVHDFGQYSPAPAPILSAAARLGVSCIVKCAPMDSISALLQQFPTCSAVYVVAVGREVKEVLLVFQPQAAGAPPFLEAVMLGKHGGTMRFTLMEEQQAPVEYAKPLYYVYDLHPALMKAGAFRSVAARYRAYKLHPNTHLYTSSEFLPHFPGRAFTCLAVLRPSAADLRPYLPERAAHVFTRNYPLSSTQLMEALHLKEGGNHFVAGCTLMDGKKSLLLLQQVEGV
jgi:hypothetical protein